MPEPFPAMLTTIQREQARWLWDGISWEALPGATLDAINEARQREREEAESWRGLDCEAFFARLKAGQ